MMLAPCTFTNLPAIPKRAYISNEAYNLLIAQGQRMYARWNTPPRRTLAVSDFRYSPVAHGWLRRQEVLYRQEVTEPQPLEPEPQPVYHQTFTYSCVAFHGWRKLAWYVIGLLENVSHVWRVVA